LQQVLDRNSLPTPTGMTTEFYENAPDDWQNGFGGDPLVVLK